MSDDNADLGIAITAARAAKERLAEHNGLEKQQHWSHVFLNDRVVVYLFALCIMALIFTWIGDFSSLTRLVATLCIFVTGVALILSTHHQKRRIQHERERQAKDFSGSS